MTARLGFGCWWAELGGRQNTVPNEFGTNDRMNPVFRRYNVKNPFFIIPILCIPNLLRIMAWILRFARNDAWARVWVLVGGRLQAFWNTGFNRSDRRIYPVKKGGVFSSLCRMNSAPTTG